MSTLLIFIWIWAAMIATSFWESSVEGRNAWDKKKLGWRLKIGRYVLSAYHFWLFMVMFPLLITLPLIVSGWDTRLFGILLSAFVSGVVMEDIMWFVVNPAVKFSEWNPEFAGYYPWIRIRSINIPIMHVIGVLIALLSWFFFWR